jgi:hypothetical protein
MGKYGFSHHPVRTLENINENGSELLKFTENRSDNSDIYKSYYE